MKRAVMRCVEILSYYMGLDILLYWLNRSAKRVVCFHNILPDEVLDGRDQGGICFRASQFRTVIRGLKRYRDSVEITFDDGYLNQYDFSAFEPTDKITCFDDMVFNFQFFAKIKRMGFIREKLYHYAKTEGGAVRGFSKKKTNDFKWMMRNHWRLCKVLFASGEYSTLKLWVGHIKWSVLNRRNHIVSKARAMIRR